MSNIGLLAGNKKDTLADVMVNL